MMSEEGLKKAAARDDELALDIENVLRLVKQGMVDQHDRQNRLDSIRIQLRRIAWIVDEQ